MAASTHPSSATGCGDPVAVLQANHRLLWGVAYLLQFVLRNHERSLMLMKKERKRSRGVLRQSAGMGGVRQEQDGVP
ncbi:hypothetical protein ZWY2020_039080 [Hordeum vulgare]|nr:hypothetical protein ZWY2020_039080 [Hordeum vulgare]